MKIRPNAYGYKTKLNVIHDCRLTFVIWICKMVKYRPTEKFWTIQVQINVELLLKLNGYVFPHENSLHDGQSFIFLGSLLERSRALKVEKCILFCTLLLHNNYSFMKKEGIRELIFLGEKWWKWLMKLSHISTFLCVSK